MLIIKETRTITNKNGNNKTKILVDDHGKQKIFSIKQIMEKKFTGTPIKVSMGALGSRHKEMLDNQKVKRTKTGKHRIVSKEIQRLQELIPILIRNGHGNAVQSIDDLIIELQSGRYSYQDAKEFVKLYESLLTK